MGLALLVKQQLELGHRHLDPFLRERFHSASARCGAVARVGRRIGPVPGLEPALVKKICQAACGVPVRHETFLDRVEAGFRHHRRSGSVGAEAG
jgi:hypothetical protein